MIVYCIVERATGGCCGIDYPTYQDANDTLCDMSDCARYFIVRRKAAYGAIASQSAAVVPRVTMPSASSRTERRDQQRKGLHAIADIVTKWVGCKRETDQRLQHKRRQYDPRPSTPEWRRGWQFLRQERGCKIILSRLLLPERRQTAGRGMPDESFQIKARSDDEVIKAASIATTARKATPHRLRVTSRGMR